MITAQPVSLSPTEGLHLHFMKRLNLLHNNLSALFHLFKYKYCSSFRAFTAADWALEIVTFDKVLYNVCFFTQEYKWVRKVFVQGRLRPSGTFFMGVIISDGNISKLHGRLSLIFSRAIIDYTVGNITKHIPE